MSMITFFDTYVLGTLRRFDPAPTGQTLCRSS